MLRDDLQRAGDRRRTVPAVRESRRAYAVEYVAEAALSGPKEEA